jgi:hypothetical protein
MQVWRSLVTEKKENFKNSIIGTSLDGNSLGIDLGIPSMKSAKSQEIKKTEGNSSIGKLLLKSE